MLASVGMNHRAHLLTKGRNEVLLYVCLEPLEFVAVSPSLFLTTFVFRNAFVNGMARPLPRINVIVHIDAACLFV